MHDTRVREMNETEIRELRARFRGELITPADPAYEGARKVYDAMIDRRPALIARCADVADAVTSVNFARHPFGVAAYRDNYARLAQVKRKYDPANLFRVDQNIRPADA